MVRLGYVPASTDSDLEEVALNYSRKIHIAQQRAKNSARDLSVEEIADNIRNPADAILHCAGKCSNLKGTIQGALRAAASAIAGSVEILRDRTTDTEVRWLQADNKRLSEELAYH